MSTCWNRFVLVFKKKSKRKIKEDDILILYIVGKSQLLAVLSKITQKLPSPVSQNLMEK